MQYTLDGKSVRKEYGRYFESCFKFLIALLCWEWLLTAPSYAQMGYVTIYSDVYVDTPAGLNFDPDNGADLQRLDQYQDGEVTTRLGGRICGLGYTEDSYNSYGHTYWVTTTIITPSGSQYSSTGLPASAELDIGAPLESGSYYIDSEHYYECP